MILITYFLREENYSSVKNLPGDKEVLSSHFTTTFEQQLISVTNVKSVLFIVVSTKILILLGESTAHRQLGDGIDVVR